MSDPTAKLSIDTPVPGYCRASFDNPPINTIDDQMYHELLDLVDAMEAEPAVKVVTFESANPNFFISHYGVTGLRSRFGKPEWHQVATRLARSNVLSIAVVRGRARGRGNEFALACDLRFASQEKAIFGQPEAGFGLIPSGGAFDKLPLLVGRSRAIEILLGADDFDAATAERYGWINRAVPDAELDDFVARFVRRILQFDGETLSMAKRILNGTSLPSADEFASIDALAGERRGSRRAVELMQKASDEGLGTLGEFELDMGRRLADL